MSELTRVLTRTCPSNFHFSMEFVSESRRDLTHVATYDRGAWHCTCESFKYRDACKHIDIAEGHRCGWAADAFANTVYHEEVCPECGEATTPFYFGA